MKKNYSFIITLVIILIGSLAISSMFSGCAERNQVLDLDLLLPAPQEIETTDGFVSLELPITVSAPEKWVSHTSNYLWLLNEVLQERSVTPATVVENDSSATIQITFDIEKDTLPKEGYKLTIGNGVVKLSVIDSSGLFNGLATLAQLMELSGRNKIVLPNIRIRDWPELATRAVHIDMTGQQYTAVYIQLLMKKLARYKVNAILMEYSDMFPFREHKVISRADAFTEKELQEICRTALKCNQEIIPVIQSAGHLKYVLTHKEYAYLSEGREDQGYSYCLAKPEVLPFAKSLIDEILAQHPGIKRLHVGGDEVKPGNCKQCAKAEDFDALYLEHYAQIAEHCLQKGITPLIWTDVLAPLQMQKEDKEKAVARVKKAAEVMSRNLVGVDWNYYGTEFNVAPILKEAGLQSMTAPAARCYGDMFDLPQINLHMENIRSAFMKAVEWNLNGAILTSWSYRGSPHEVCMAEYIGVAYGWNTSEANIPALLERFFQQRYGLTSEISVALVQAALTETKDRVPTTLCNPKFDIESRTWRLPANKQVEELIGRIRREHPADLIDSLKEQMQLFANNNASWQTALQTATRHQIELQSWDLSRRHLMHRLQLSIDLAQLKSGKNVEQSLDSLTKAREKLRSEWKNLYRNTFTPPHMEVELDTRFDVEPEIIEIISQWKYQPPALVGHWKLNGNTMDLVSGVNGQSSNINWVTGPYGSTPGAAAFNGQNSVITVPDTEALKLGTNDFTIAAWVKSDVPMKGVFGDIIGKFDAATRRGLNLNIAGSSTAYSSMSDTRHVHFGIDNAYTSSWADHGKPWESNSLISTLVAYKDTLYCGIADADNSADAAHVFRWTGGEEWADCGRVGNDPKHLTAMSMIVHDGKLYAGTGVWDWIKAKGKDPDFTVSPARVFVYEGGTKWRDLGKIGNGSRILCLASFNGELYAGLDKVGGGSCFKYNGSQWVDLGAPDGTNLECLIPMGGTLYAATHGSMYIYKGSQKWTCIGDFPHGITQIHSLQVFGGKLYAGTWPQGYVLRYEGGMNWTITGRLGLPEGMRECNEVMDLTVYNGKLYAGVIPKAEIYRYESDGDWTLITSLANRSDWEQNNWPTWCRITAMSIFQGKLFAGTGSCQGRAIDAPADESLGRVFSFKAGSVVSHDSDIGGEWTHITAVRHGNKLLLYINGKLSNTSELPAGHIFDLSNTEPFTIGAGAQGTFSGAISDVRLYNGALNNKQIQKLASGKN